MQDTSDKLTTLEWLETQVQLLDRWIEELSSNADTNVALRECVEGHKKWLVAELKIIKEPGRYRLSNYARNAVYPLIDQKAMRAVSA